MSFTFAPAVREQVSLLISIAGVSGSGKTYSALKLARGLATDDSRIAFIDTEAGRGLHYAPAHGETAGPSKFAFQYADMKPPFSPEAYAEAIKAADTEQFDVIVIDSASHLWEGEGGVQDMHAAILDGMVEAARKGHNGSWAFDEAKTRDRLSVGAWKGPKSAHKRLVSRLLQTRTHIILCLRADEKMRMEKVKDDRGRERTVITQAKDLPPADRWSPICEKRLPYEMTVSFVLTPDRPGYPVPIKLQDQHRAAVPLDRPLSEETGRALAEWARGGTKPTTTTATATAPDSTDDFPGDQADDPVAELIERARMTAMGGSEEYRRFFETLSREDKRQLADAGEHDRCKAAATRADGGDDGVHESREG
jgi:hypothetical protein